MLTNDKKITTAEYWNTIYEGKNDNAKVDASNTVRPAKVFDRFQWVADLVTGPCVLDVASGHAHICKRLKAMHPDWKVVASDQCSSAIAVSKYSPYEIFSAYEIPYPFKMFDTLVISQAMEYIEEQERFLMEAKRVANYFVCTVPEGEMEKWSQLRIYTEDNFKELLLKFGSLLHFEKHEGLMLAKIKFDV